MTEKENVFYSKDFKFSYSSLNKLLYSPQLFYRDYILEEREERIDKHLIEGKVVHCLLFEPDQLENKFKVTPGKAPSDNVKRVLKDLSLYTQTEQLKDVEESLVLDALERCNLYQSLKTDKQRVDKIVTADNQIYWKYISDKKVDVIDEDTLQKCKEKKEIITNNEEVMKLLSQNQTDFDLDPIQTYAEKYLECELKNKPFGLKGFIDFYEINDDTKTVTICDLKTSGKSLIDFDESVMFYNYWMQAAIYCKLVYENLPEDKRNYTILFKFIVIDKYNQVYPFDVSQLTMAEWADRLTQTLFQAEHHYKENDYSLPYAFLTSGVIL